MCGPQLPKNQEVPCTQCPPAMLGCLHRQVGLACLPLQRPWCPESTGEVVSLLDPQGTVKIAHSSSEPLSRAAWYEWSNVSF